MSGALGRNIITTTSDINAFRPAQVPTQLPTQLPPLNMATSATYVDPHFLRFLKGTFTHIVEVGSRYGDEAILLSQRFPMATVWAFEPNPLTVDVCRKTLNGLLNIKFFDHALGAQEANMPFYSYTEGNDGASSLLKRTDFHQTQRESGIIKIRKLENIMKEACITHIDYLCMDVQGFELEVLKGLGDDIKNKVTYIMLECPALDPPKGFLPQGRHSKYDGAPSYLEIEDFMRKAGFIKIHEQPENYIESNQLWVNIDHAGSSWGC